MTAKENRFFAHTREGKQPPEWHRLEDHLKRTAELAAEFAKPFGGQDWAYLAGLWHARDRRLTHD